MSQLLIRSAALLNWHSVLARKHPPSADVDNAINSITRMLSINDSHLRLSEYVSTLERLDPGQAQGLAWEVGTSAKLEDDSQISKALLGCETLGAALSWGCKFFPLQQDGTSLQLEQDDQWAMLCYKIQDPQIWPRHIDAVCNLGFQARFIKAAAPEAWSQVQLIVESESNTNSANLAKITQASVIHGGSTNAIRFPASLLDAPFAPQNDYDPTAISDLSKTLTAKERTTPISQRTRKLIFSQLNEGNVSQCRIAKSLGLSSRTLRRKLSDEGQSFRELLDLCRMQSAGLELRKQQKVSLSEIAIRLGYTEHSTFSRAFTRWAGIPPREFRLAHTGVAHRDS